MPSEILKKQNFVVRVLTSHLQQDRLAHSYLFTGKPGSGKTDVAAFFAAALHCEKKNYFQDCSCSGCRKTLNDQHPDLQWVGKDPKVRSIKIEEIRNVMNWASLKPYQSEWKIFILCASDRLTLDAANALLKTLEEPPAHTIFVLLAESRSHLLETIQSRCFEIRFKPLAEAPEAAVEAIAEPPFADGAWDDYFSGFEKLNREDLKTALTALANRFREEIRRSEGKIFESRCVEGIEVTLETKEALSANVNQKLALSRLTMRLMKAFSPEPARS